MSKTISIRPTTGIADPTIRGVLDDMRNAIMRMDGWGDTEDERPSIASLREIGLIDRDARKRLFRRVLNEIPGFSVREAKGLYAMIANGFRTTSVTIANGATSFTVTGLGLDAAPAVRQISVTMFSPTTGGGPGSLVLYATIDESSITSDGFSAYLAPVATDAAGYKASVIVVPAV